MSDIHRWTARHHAKFAHTQGQPGQLHPQAHHAAAGGGNSIARQWPRVLKSIPTASSAFYLFESSKIDLSPPEEIVYFLRFSALATGR